MLNTFKIPKQAEEIIRYKGHVFYEYKGVLYKTSLSGSNAKHHIVGAIFSRCEQG